MKLVSTKRTEAEKKAEKAKYDKPMSASEDYPYDTRLCLRKQILDKLDISPKDYKVGQTVNVEIVASVKSLRMVDGKDYDSNEIELQIEQIGIEKAASGSLKDAISAAVKDAKDE
jgi:hypothetical protein